VTGYSLREAGQDRNGNGSDADGCHIGDDPVGAVLAEDGNPVSRGDVPGEEGDRQVGDLFLQLLVGDRKVADMAEAGKVGVEAETPLHQAT